MSSDLGEYKDIIDLPHHTSSHHPQMSMEARAAQFSPFAALTGYNDATRETARLTDDKIELSEDEKTVLDCKLQLLQEHIKEQPAVTITYFVPDKKKKGGAYVMVTDNAKKIDSAKRILIMQGETAISLRDIVSIDFLRNQFRE